MSSKLKSMSKHVKRDEFNDMIVDAFLGRFFDSLEGKTEEEQEMLLNGVITNDYERGVENE